LDLLVKLFLNGKEPAPISPLQKYNEELAYDETNSFPRLQSYLFNPHQSIPPIVERAVAISKSIACVAAVSYIPIFLVIHNIEGLKHRISQDALAALTVNSIVPNGVNAIRIVASVDHVDASTTLWNYEALYRFNWIWKEVHTHRPYVHELVMLSDQDVFTKKQTTKIRKNQSHSEQSVRFLDVLGSLAPRSCDIAQVLAQLQLDQTRYTETSESTEAVSDDLKGWVDFKLFRSKCKEKFFISTDAELRKLMHEFIDHRLMQSKLEGSSQYVTIPFGMTTLKEIISYKR
jgi:Origin recognition complex subunit 2